MRVALSSIGQRAAAAARRVLFALPPETWVAALGVVLVTVGVAQWSGRAACVVCGLCLLWDVHQGRKHRATPRR